MSERESSSRDAESRLRLGRMREAMRELGLDALFLAQPTNVWYASGFWEFIPIRMEAVLVPLEGDCVFLVSKNEHEYAANVSWIRDVRYYTEFPEDRRHQNPFDLIHEIVREKGLEKGVIGVEESFLPVADHRRLVKMLPAAKFPDASLVTQRCRRTKSPS